MRHNTCNFTNDFNAISQFLKGFAYKLTQDPHKAEDLYQETALLALRNREKFEMGTNMKAWLCTIMRNTFINGFRRKQRRKEVAGIELNPNTISIVTDNDGENRLGETELMSFINDLSEDMRQPFLMAYQGYKYEEISEFMDTPLGTIKSRIFSARKILQEKVLRSQRLGLAQ